MHRIICIQLIKFMLTLTTEADLVVVAAVAATAELLVGLEGVVLILKMFTFFRFTKVKCDDINDTKRFRFI